MIGTRGGKANWGMRATADNQLKLCYQDLDDLLIDKFRLFQNLRRTN